MTRAAVLIGVSSTGELPLLQGVESGVDGLQSWAYAQGMAEDHVVRITDRTRPVGIGDIKSAVRALCDRGDIQQLFVYFAGHGFSLNYGEFWLLSDAPRDPDAAVNVAHSMDLARHSGIRHVVIFSDACRTAASGIVGQAVTGGAIFPNDGPGGNEHPVDVFFASSLGKPALEVRGAMAEEDSSASGIFTDALLTALRGDEPTVVEAHGPDSDAFIRPWPLKWFLLDEVSQRAAALGGGVRPQQPDARITSDPSAWVARLAPQPFHAVPEWTADAVPAARRRDHTGPVAGQWRSEEAVRRLLQRLLGTAPAAMPGQAHGVDAEPGAIVTLNGGQAVDVDWSSSAAVLDLQGARAERVTVVTPLDAGETVLDADGRILARFDGPAIGVEVHLADERRARLVLHRDTRGVLVFRDGELRDVHTEHRDDALAGAARNRVAAVRAVCAAGLRLGFLTLTAADIEALYALLVRSASLDPVLALYSAYAFDEAGRGDLLTAVSDLTLERLGILPFDVALLSARRRSPADAVVAHAPPGFPLLSRGWPRWELVGERAVAVRDASRRVEPGLWTVLRGPYPTSDGS